MKKLIVFAAAVMLAAFGLTGCPDAYEDGGAEENRLSGTVTISGTLQVAQTLTAETGEVSGDGVLSFQWKRGDSADGDFTGIEDAANPTYPLVQDDQGKYIKVSVTREGYTGSVESAAAGPVAAEPGLPALTGTLTITGTPKVGENLNADTSGVDGDGALSYQWKRGDSAGGAFTNIENTSGAYQLAAEDEGKYIKASVTRAGYTGSVESAAIGPVDSNLVELLVINFDNLTAFRNTANPPSPAADSIFDYQLGGDSGPAVELSSEQNHTSGAGTGKSLKWSNRTLKYQRIKFDNVFSEADAGRTFNISIWVHSSAATKVLLGAFSVSGGSGSYGGNPIAKNDFDISTGWNRLVWSNYLHTDLTVTQLGFQQLDSGEVSVVSTFYIDDIVVQASPIAETTVKNIVFDDLTAFADWQGGGGSPSVSVSIDRDHTTGSGKSLKFTDREGAYTRLKFEGIFTPGDLNKKFNASMWVYTDTSTWIQLSVFIPSNNTYVTRRFFRVEPGWNKLSWRGYVHTNTEVTQLGIEQQGAEAKVDTFYIDDLLVTKID
jgi:hypothetical protein